MFRTALARPILVAITVALTRIPSASAGYEVPLQATRFEHTYNTVFGQSVFVLGDIVELGGGDVRKAVKLVPVEMTPGGLLWRVDIGIPQGTAYTYRFVLRNDAVAAYRDPANGTFLTPPASGAAQTPTPALRDRVVYSLLGDGATETIFLNLPGTLSRDFIPVPNRPALQAAAVFQRPNGPGIDFQILAGTFDTPRHAIVHRAGALFDYVPTSPDSIGSIVTFALPTALIPATRTVNGVTGRGVRV